MAAWADGGLPDEALRLVRAHVADCQRCQVLAAVMARVEAAGREAVATESPSRRWLGWMLPLAAAAGAVVIWIALPRDTTPLEDAASPAAQMAQAPGPPASAPAPSEAPMGAVGARPAAPKLGAERQLADAAKPQMKERVEEARANAVRTDEVRDRAALASTTEAKRTAPPAAAAEPPPAAAGAPPPGALRTVPPPPPPPATPPPPAQARAERVALGQAAAGGGGRGGGGGLRPIEVAVPDGTVRWRLAGADVKKSSDAGKTWEEMAVGVDGEFTAGAAPTSTVCWLVGKAGLILLTTDGRTWRRIEFPAKTDLSSIRAIDARNAVVTTADGRTFVTADAGATWIQKLLQEN
jgi:hypothetical protein